MEKGYVKLSEAAILGKEMKYPEGLVSCPPDDHDCIKQATEVLEKLYPEQEEEMKVPPATWKYDLARYVFGTINARDDGPSSEGGAVLAHHDHRVNVVPIFWQLIGSDRVFNIDDYDIDCTHKSLSATYFMNFQLLRAIETRNIQLVDVKED